MCNIDQIILSLQFQDITKQEIDATGIPLQQISHLAQDMVNKLTSMLRLDATEMDEPRRTPTLSAEPKAPAAPVHTPEPAPSHSPTAEESTEGAAPKDVLFF